MPDDLVPASESTDIAAWSDMFDAAPDAFRARHQLRATLDAGTLLLTSTGLRIGHFNSMIGLGVHMPATQPQLDAALALFQTAGASRFDIHLVPGAQPPDVEQWLLARNLRPNGAWDRIGRGAQPHDLPRDREASVDLIDNATAAEWAQFIDKVYHLANEPWLVALVDRPGWRHYVIRDNAAIVAARSMYIAPNRYAWLGIDAPIPGLMTNRFDRDLAICARMVRDGLTMGAAAFFTDIEAPHPDRNTPAYTGFAELGFSPLYLRRQFSPAPPAA